MRGSVGALNSLERGQLAYSQIKTSTKRLSRWTFQWHSWLTEEKPTWEVMMMEAMRMLLLEERHRQSSVLPWHRWVPPAGRSRRGAEPSTREGWGSASSLPGPATYHKHQNAAANFKMSPSKVHTATHRAALTGDFRPRLVFSFSQ